MALLVPALSLGCSSSDKDKGGGAGGQAGDQVNWTTMGYDLQSTYHNTKETKITKDNVSQLALKWKIPTTPVDAGGQKIQMYGTPVIVGDTLYIGASDGVHCVDANTGAEKWVYAEGSAAVGVSSSMSYENGILYFTASGAGGVIALDVTQNPPVTKWDMVSTPDNLGFSSATIVGDLIVTGNSILDTATTPPYRGGVTALHKSDGTPAWQAYTCDTTEDGCAVWGTVSVDPTLSTVFAPVGNNYTMAGPGSDSVYALDAKTGDVKWHKQVTPGDTFVVTNPLVGNDWDFGANPVVFDYNGKKLVAAGAKSGQLYVWDRELGGTPVARDLGGHSAWIGGVFQGLAFDGERLIVVCNSATSTAPDGEPDDPAAKGGNSVLFGLEPDTLNIIYERQLSGWAWNPITIANGVGFVGLQTKLEAFDVATGKVLFTYPVAGTIGSGITISNGRIFFGSGMSYLSFFNHEDGSVLSLALP
jgi:glucose dehydrogenase